MLTADEIVLAGGTSRSSSTFYLNNGSINYWSLSPDAFYIATYASEFKVGNGRIGGNSVIDGSSGLRPAISLKPGTPVVSGTGTATNPYVIK